MYRIFCFAVKGMVRYLRTSQLPTPDTPLLRGLFGPCLGQIFVCEQMLRKSHSTVFAQGGRFCAAKEILTLHP